MLHVSYVYYVVMDYGSFLILNLAHFCKRMWTRLVIYVDPGGTGAANSCRSVYLYDVCAPHGQFFATDGPSVLSTLAMHHSLWVPFGIFYVRFTPTLCPGGWYRSPYRYPITILGRPRRLFSYLRLLHKSTWFRVSNPNSTCGLSTVCWSTSCGGF